MSSDDDDEDYCRATFAFVVKEGKTIKTFPKNVWVYKEFNEFCIYKIPGNIKSPMKTLRNACRYGPFEAYSLSVAKDTKNELKLLNFKYLVQLLYEAKHKSWGQETNARLAYILLKMVPLIDYVDSRWDKHGDDANFKIKSNILQLINNMLEEVDYDSISGSGEACIEFKDGKYYKLKDTIEKLHQHASAQLRLLFLTGCKITDYAKSKCKAKNICVLDMESYKTLLASILIYLLELDINNFNVFYKSYEKYYSHLEESTKANKKRKILQTDHQFIHHNRILLYQEEKGEPFKFVITNGRSTSSDDCIMVNTLQMKSQNHSAIIFKCKDFNQSAKAIKKKELYGVKNKIINVEAEVDNDFQLSLKRENFNRLLESAISFN